MPRSQDSDWGRLLWRQEPGDVVADRRFGRPHVGALRPRHPGLHPGPALGVGRRLKWENLPVGRAFVIRRPAATKKSPFAYSTFAISACARPGHGAAGFPLALRLRRVRTPAIRACHAHELATIRAGRHTVASSGVRRPSTRHDIGGRADRDGSERPAPVYSPRSGWRGGSWRVSTSRCRCFGLLALQVSAVGAVNLAAGLASQCDGKLS